MSESIFGPIFDGSILSRAALAHLRAWFPTYIQEIELAREYDRGEIPVPRTYVERWTFDSYPDDQIPAVIAVCPGMAGPPHKDGDGVYHGWWALGVGIIAAAATEPDSERLAKIYGAGARTILSQKPYLDDSWEFSAYEVMDESYDDLPDIEQGRTMRSAHVIGRVFVENIWHEYGGPMHMIPPDPDTQPGSQWPDVQEVFTEVVMKED